MESLSFIQRLVVWALPALFAITLHEAAHGWTARWLGDSTAQRLGRVSLNPLRHIDPMGTVLVPALMLLLSGMVFGWAKPVPVAWNRLRHPRRDMAIVAAAGPLANLAMAMFWAFTARLGGLLLAAGVGFGRFLVLTGVAGVFVNLIVMVVNLFPVPPLDGGRVATGLLPPRIAWKLAHVEPFGMFILIALLATGLLGTILGPVLDLFSGVFAGIVGLHEAQFHALVNMLAGQGSRR